MIVSRRTLTSSIILASLASRVSAAASRSAQGLRERLSALCNDSIRARRATGIAVHVRRGHDVLASLAFGFANLETPTPLSPDSVFRIGSVSKQFAAASLLLLAEDGKLALDDPLARFLPDFPRVDEVTLRMLLDHTSGISNIGKGIIPSVDYSMPQIVEIIKSQTPLYGFDPGTRWAYSNTGFGLAGAVIEKVTGAPFYEFYRQRIYPRAGMTATDVDKRADIVPHRASGYSLAGDGRGFENAIDLSWTIPGAAGCLRSTAIDLGRWHEALFNGRILRAESLREMTSPSRLKDGRLASAGRNGPAAGTQPDQEYGLGLELSIVDGKKRAGHYGSIPGFGADMATFPELDLTVVVLTNTDFGPNNPPREIDRNVLASV